MANKLKLGLVGADAEGRGWGPVAHMPALREIEQIELAALCTSRPESAAAAERAYGIKTYHDIDDLVRQPDIDIISTVIRIPSHYDIVMAALNAGKHVYCEWPLGATLAETEEMATLAQKKGVVAAIGLQGWFDPTLVYIKELFKQGWLGELLTINMSMKRAHLPNRISRGDLGSELSRRGNMFEIIGGHTLGYLTNYFGPIAKLSAHVETRLDHLLIKESDEVFEVNTQENILVNAKLTNGGLLSYQLTAVPFHADGWRMEVHGSKGTLIATTPGLPQITPVKLIGSQGNAPLQELAIPERLRFVPKTVPLGPAQNVGHGYIQMAEAINANTPFSPSFEDALRIHKLLDLIQRSSNEGRALDI